MYCSTGSSRMTTRNRRLVLTSTVFCTSRSPKGIVCLSLTKIPCGRPQMPFRGGAKSVSRSRHCLSLANEIRRCTRVQVSIVADTDFKTPRGGSSQPGRLSLFRQPVVRSGDATHRPAVTPRRTPVPAAESLVAPVSPSPAIDVFSIGDNNRNTN